MMVMLCERPGIVSVGRSLSSPLALSGVSWRLCGLSGSLLKTTEISKILKSDAVSGVGERSRDVQYDI